MKLKKCDRCGKIYPRNNNRYGGGDVPRIAIGISLIDNKRTLVNRYDLCDDCIDNFVNSWMKPTMEL